MDEVENIRREILQYISSVFDVLSKDINTDEINIEIQNKSHKNPKFCDGKMYVYSFWYNKIDVPLKIGKAGPKSKARYTSHHYNVNSSNSCLAKQILSDKEFVEKYNVDISSGQSLSNWIHRNCQRINIEMPYDTSTGYDLFTLELIEAILHNLYMPKYEGR